MCLPALARVPLQSAMSMTGIFSSCHLMIMSLAAVLQGMRLSCRSVIEVRAALVLTALPLAHLQPKGYRSINYPLLNAGYRVREG
uniref:Uncharacterized protein n=1 Tax=Aegilops tauschii subsp. strangulata TaxID=200361 RepID=A0A453KMT3_AEGTS